MRVISISRPGGNPLLVIQIREMSEMKKECCYLTLLLRRKSGNALLNFFNAHREDDTETPLESKRVAAPNENKTSDRLSRQPGCGAGSGKAVIE